MPGPWEKYQSTGPWSSRQVMPDFSDVQSGVSSTGYQSRLTPLQIATASYRGGRMPQSPEEEAAIEEAGAAGFGAANKTALGLASGGAGSAMNRLLVPFLARLGTGARATQALASAGTGAGIAGTDALPQLARGDLGGAAETVASGAAFGGAVGLVPGAGPLVAKLVKAGIAPQQAGQIAKAVAAEAQAAAPAVAAPLAAAAPAVAAVPAAAAPAAAAPALRQLMQLAKESGAKAGQKVWFLLENGLPVKILTPDMAAAAKRAGQATTWVKAF